MTDAISEHANKMIKEAGTIDCTPSWVSVVSIYLEVLASGDAASR